MEAAEELSEEAIVSRLLQARVRVVKLGVVGHGLFSEAAIVSPPLQVGGAHKPNGWDFGDGLGLKFTDEW